MRSRRSKAGGFAVITGLVLALVLVGDTGAAAHSLDKPSAAAVPTRVSLSASLGATGGTWAEVAMGRLGQLANTFWELFYQSGRSAHWSLVTPPGFADNGGLVTAVVGSRLVVGFGASQLLHFSPMASSGDDGVSWSPGVLDEPLTTVPDALTAVGASGIDALVGDPAHAVVAGGIGLSQWAQRVSLRSLAASSAGRACGLTALTALGESPSGSPLLGGTCSRSAKAGIFEDSSSGWRLVGVTLATGVGSSSVLRLRATGDGTSAIVAFGSGGVVRIMGLRLDEELTPTDSAILALGEGERIVSSAVSATGALDVLASADGHLVAEVLATHAHKWAQLPEPPRNTAVVSFDPRGGMDALAVDGSEFTAYYLATGTARWRRAQAMQVPIQYGSSS